jgi:hypothetical protein
VVKLDPIQGFVLYAIPGRHLRSGRAFVALAAFDAGGKRLARRGLTVDIGTG